MGILSNLNNLATIGTFGCIAFALSGFGVKLGKISSLPHKLGYTYISESLLGEDKKDKLYEATAKINQKYNPNGPEWTRDKGKLKEWCKDNEKSTRKWGANSQHCLIKNNAWHKLIEKGVDLKEPIPEETTSSQSENSASGTDLMEKCTLEVLNRFADGEEHVNYLLGKRACLKEGAQATGQAVQASSSLV